MEDWQAAFATTDTSAKLADIQTGAMSVQHEQVDLR
jgi:hypothetical protein